MYELQADLWALGSTADAIVITTNGSLKRNGDAVMGKGCALDAAEIDPLLPARLGMMIAVEGNRLHVFHGWKETTALVAFPVKHQWYNRADLSLIVDSTVSLLDEANRWDWEDVVLPRPGCGAGRLDWEKNVKPLIEIVLDNRFTVVWK